MQRLVRITAALVLSLTLGLHWVVLQSFAWTTMVIERTQSASFVVALQTTFDGQHPCKLCQFVQEGKSAEQAPEAPVKPPKFEIFSTPVVQCQVRPQVCEPLQMTDLGEMTARSWRPLSPPPRAG